MISWRNPAAVHPPAGQYTHAVVVPQSATTVYIAGQVGADPAGVLAPDFEAQVRQAFGNLVAVLADNEMTLADLLQVNYYLVDPGHLPILRSVRSEFLHDPPPASTALIVVALAQPSWLFEMDAVAARMPTESAVVR